MSTGQMVQGAPAAELSDEEQKKRAEVAFALDKSIKASLRAGRIAAWDLAKAIYDFDQESGWLGLGYEKMADWLADPEVSMTYRTFRRYSDVWREVVVLRNVDPKELEDADPTKVDIVLPKVKQGKKIGDALNDVKMMGVKDLRETYIAPRPTPAPREDAGEEKDAIADPPVTPNDGSEAPVRASDVGTPEDVLEGRAVEVGRPEPDALGAIPPDREGNQDLDPDHNPHNGASGHLPDNGEHLTLDLVRGMAQLLEELFEAYGAPEKKKFSKDHRQRLDHVLAQVYKTGLLDQS
jgi:hypothetical protein